MEKMNNNRAGQPDDSSVAIALDTLAKKKQALIFANTKSSAEKAAEEIALRIKLDDNGADSADYRKQLEQLSQEILDALPKHTKQCERLAKCVKKGVAFHHAGLVYKQRELIEDNFREGKIKIICSTPTLAYGLDLPAFRAVIRDLKRYGGPRGMSWIPVLEYQQICGRAGRPKYDSYGEAIAIAKTEKEAEEIKERYIDGESEDIYSKLAVEPVLRTYVLSLIASEFVRTRKQLIDFFSKTFWAYQYEDTQKLKDILGRMVSLLEDYEFVVVKSSRPKKKDAKERTKDDFVSADLLLEEEESVAEDDNDILEATDIGLRVSQLYIDPLTAHNMMNSLKRSVQKLVNEFSLLQMVSYTLEMRPLLNVRQSEEEDIDEKIVEHDANLITSEPPLYDPEYGFFLNSIKTALFFNDWVNEKDEEELLEKYNIRPGEIKVKLDLADWLLYSAEEIARMIKMSKMISEIIKARLRLKYGVKEELLPLLKLDGIGRVRARKLYNNRIRELEDVRKADVMALVQILGKQTAISIKKQVGQDIDKEKIPEGKRKGQISLEDY